MRTPSKYKHAHQSRRECERRLRQIRNGQLSGRCGRKNRSEFVSLAARGFTA